MKTTVRFNFVIITFIISVSVFGQIPQAIDYIEQNESASYYGELVSYQCNGNIETWMEDIQISLNKSKTVNCRLSAGELSEYWIFNIDSLYHENGLLIGNLSNIHLEGTDTWAYIDDKATGTYTYDEENDLETLNIDFHIHKNKTNYVISWKAPTSVYRWKTSIMDIDIVGKTFCGLTEQDLSEELVNTYCKLKFGKDSVAITNYKLNEYSGKIAIINETKSGYKSVKMNGSIIINELFTTYGAFIVQETNLICRERKNDEKDLEYSDRSIVFYDTIE